MNCKALFDQRTERAIRRALWKMGWRLHKRSEDGEVCYCIVDAHERPLETFDDISDALKFTRDEYKTFTKA